MNTELSFDQQIVIESTYDGALELLQFDLEPTVYDAVMSLAESLCEGGMHQGVWFEDDADTLQAVKAFIWYLAQGSGNYFDGYDMGGPAPVEPVTKEQQTMKTDRDIRITKDGKTWTVREWKISKNLKSITPSYCSKILLKGCESEAEAIGARDYHLGN